MAGGSFSSPALYGGGPIYQGIGAGDLDGDGRPELITGVFGAVAELPNRCVP